MGGGRYNSESRSLRATTMGYFTKDADEVFIQNKKREIHESMEPSKALLRESRDSKDHPNSVPIIVALDLTGSMLEIPKSLIREGLPTMVGNIIQKGIPDPAILFLGVGDHECDQAPLQVGQFESGDEELDLWLTRTWLEGKGGGNAGESYHLAWYFAANHTVTDDYEKRANKGILFTIGDEPCLPNLPKHAIEELMGHSVQSSFTARELLEAAQKKYDVYHLHCVEGSNGIRALGYWKDLLHQHCVEVKHFEDIPKIIADIVISNVQSRVSHDMVNPVVGSIDEKPKKVIL